jgi:hypothetical protein
VKVLKTQTQQKFGGNTLGTTIIQKVQQIQQTHTLPRRKKKKTRSISEPCIPDNLLI